MVTSSGCDATSPRTLGDMRSFSCAFRGSPAPSDAIGNHVMMMMMMRMMMMMMMMKSHRNHVPSTMVASSEQCRRHVSGAAGATASFSDDGVVQSVLKELKGVGEDQRAGTKSPLVSPC